MAVAPEDFYAYVNALIDEDKTRAAGSLAEAEALVNAFVGEGNPWRVPQLVIDRAQTEVAAELYHRKGTRSGIAGFDNEGGMPFRVGVDPLKPAYPLFAPFLPRAI